MRFDYLVVIWLLSLQLKSLVNSDQPEPPLISRQRMHGWLWLRERGIVAALYTPKKVDE